MSIARDPRQSRLRTERERLEALNRESDYIQVEPIDLLPGSQPERYRVTFRCKGIMGIDNASEPVYGWEHVVEINCGEAFPSDLPRLRWITEIWHPNISHKEPKIVCINNAAWLGFIKLDDLCRQMFEMVQYKNYHAENIEPYPLDMEVARWVLEYAEPRGIIDKKKNIFVGDRPFLRPAGSSQPAPPSPISLSKPKVIILEPVPSPLGASAAPPAPSQQRHASVRILQSPDPQKDPVSPAPRVKIIKKD